MSQPENAREEHAQSPIPVVAEYKPEGDPFINATEKLSFYNKCKFIFPGLILIPLRFVAFLICLAFVTLMSVLCTIGKKKSVPPKPFTGTRQAIMEFSCSWGARAILFTLGFHRVRVKGVPACTKDAPIVVCNHAAPWEGFGLAAYHHITFLSRAENKSAPFLGVLLKARQAIFVDRSDAASRHTVVDEVRRRSKEPGWPALGIFPEGTTVNTRELLAFRTGAFQPGVPVQPVSVKYPWKHLDVSYSGTVSLPALIFRMQSQFYNRMELEFMPVYYPSKLEQEDAQLFADNVRDYMSHMAKIQTSEYNVEDFYLTNAALKMGMNPTEAVVGMERLKRVLHMGVADVKGSMQLFKDLDVGKKGKIKVEDFAKALGLPLSDPVRATFKRISDGADVLTFRQFLTTMSMHSGELTTEEQIRFVFDCVNLKGDGKFTLEELRAVMLLVSEDMEAQSDAIFKKIDSQHRGYIDFIQLGSFIRSNPQWMELFEEVRSEQKARGTNPVLEMLADKVEGKPWTVAQFRERVQEQRRADKEGKKSVSATEKKEQ